MITALLVGIGLEVLLIGWMVGIAIVDQLRERSQDKPPPRPTRLPRDRFK